MPYSEDEKPELYTIASQSKYCTQFELVENLEDVTGDVFTRDEVREMLGVEQKEYFYLSTSSPIVNEKNVEEALRHYKSEMKRLNKKSIVCTDDELLEFLKHQTYSPISVFVEGLRRIGDRLYLHEKAAVERKPKKTDVSEMMYRALSIINERYGFHMEVKYLHESYTGAIEVIKKLVSWEELLENVTKHRSEEDIKMYELLWNDNSYVTAFDAK